MTLKTDLKFGLLLILILGGAALLMIKVIHSAQLSPRTLADKLHRNMTRIEVGKLVGADLQTKWGVGQTLEAVYTLRQPAGSVYYLFEFDIHERLQQVYIDRKLPSGNSTRTPLELH